MEKSKRVMVNAWGENLTVKGPLRTEVCTSVHLWDSLPVSEGLLDGNSRETENRKIEVEGEGSGVGAIESERYSEGLCSPIVSKLIVYRISFRKHRKTCMGAFEMCIPSTVLTGVFTSIPFWKSLTYLYSTTVVVTSMMVLEGYRYVFFSVDPS